MKKFYAGSVKGVSATQIKATDLLSIALTKDTTVEAITDATGGAKVLELLNNALSEGRATYAITSNLTHVKETVANVLQAKFMQRINALVEIVMSNDDLEQLNDYVEDGRISNEVVEYVTDLYNARKAEEETVTKPVEPVTIEAGINLSADQVLSMMNARGLVIGGTAKAAMGEGTVLGFVVGQIGTMVVLNVQGKQHTVMATKVESNNQTKGAVQSMNNNNQQSVVTSRPSLQFVAPVNEEAKAVVESAVEASVETPWEELTVEQREAMEEARLQADLAAFNEAQAEKSAQASKVAGSSAAQALKALGGGAQTPASVNRNVAPVASSASAPVANVRNNQQNQNRGGNVQMTNNNNGAVQTRGAQSAQASVARQGSTPSLAFGGAQVGRQGSTPSLALGGAFAQAPAGGAWAEVAPVMALPTVEFTGTNNAGGQDFVWYIAEAAKYEGQIMDLATLHANNFANPNIGITGMKFCTPESVANFFNREVKQDDFMWVEVFFGTTSYEFMFSKNSQADSRPYIYSRNIARKQTKGGTWFCEYVTSRRTDKLEVVQQADGVIREARKQWDREARAFVIHPEDAPFVQEVGGQGWVNTAPNYGIRVGQQVFIQLMVMFDEQQGLKAARDAK